MKSLISSFGSRHEVLFFTTVLLMALVDPIILMMSQVNKHTYCKGHPWHGSSLIGYFRSISDLMYIVLLVGGMIKHFKERNSSYEETFSFGDAVFINRRIFLHTPRTKIMVIHYLFNFFLLVPFWQIIIFWHGKVTLHIYYIGICQLGIRMLRSLIFNFRAVLMPLFWSDLQSLTINVLLIFQVGITMGSLAFVFGVKTINDCLEGQCATLYPGTNCMHNLFCAGSMAFSTSKPFRKCFDPNNVANKGLFQHIIPQASEDTPTTIIKSLYWGIARIYTVPGKDVPNASMLELALQFIFTMITALTLFLVVPNILNMLQANLKRIQESNVKSWDYRRTLRKLPQTTPELKEGLLRSLRVYHMATDGIDEDKVISGITSIPHRRQINDLRFICLRKNPYFKCFNERVWLEICEKLKVQHYYKGEKIQERESLVKEIVFVVQGTVSTDPQFSTNFHGEELLYAYLRNWLARYLKFERLVEPVKSNTTVTCLTSVKSYILPIDDLERVYERYACHIWTIRKELRSALRSGTYTGRIRSAVLIQTRWRYLKMKPRKVVVRPKMRGLLDMDVRPLDISKLFECALKEREHREAATAARTGGL